MTFAQDNYLTHFLGDYETQVSPPVLNEVRDHYYMATTAAMANGNSFDKALADTHEAFGGRHGILSLEWPFQKSLVIRNRAGIEQSLGNYLWGRKLPITIGIFLLMWWNNNAPAGEHFPPLSMFAVPGLLFLLLHILSYYTEGMSKRSGQILLLLIVVLMIAYFILCIYLVDKPVHSSRNLYLSVTWIAFQTFLTLVYLANIQQKKSPYLKRKEDIYGAI